MLPTGSAWPNLPPAADEALRELIPYVLVAYDPVGIVVSGSIVRGEGGPLSDLDVFVVHLHPWRLREQKRFRGVPAELFVNPPERIRRYFVLEHAAGRPGSAHMLATGTIVHATDPVVAALVQEAHEWLARAPQASEEQLVRLKYEIVDLLDDARDAPETESGLLLSRVVDRTVEAIFWHQGRPQPRRKAILAALGASDPHAAELVRDFVAAPATLRLGIAESLVRHAVGVDTFFEWTSSRD